jgi:hypothetical protein
VTGRPPASKDEGILLDPDTSTEILRAEQDKPRSKAEIASMTKSVQQVMNLFQKGYETNQIFAASQKAWIKQGLSPEAIDAKRNELRFIINMATKNMKDSEGNYMVHQ